MQLHNPKKQPRDAEWGPLYCEARRQMAMKQDQQKTRDLMKVYCDCIHRPSMRMNVPGIWGGIYPFIHTRVAKELYMYPIRIANNTKIQKECRKLTIAWGKSWGHASRRTFKICSLLLPPPSELASRSDWTWATCATSHWRCAWEASSWQTDPWHPGRWLSSWCDEASACFESWCVEDRTEQETHKEAVWRKVRIKYVL